MNAHWNKKTSCMMLASLLAVMGGGLAQAESQINLRLAYAQNPQPVKDALAHFGELVEEKSDGSITVTFFPDSQLGGEGELVELLQRGAIDMTKVSGGLMESFSPLYQVFSMPYLFDDESHFREVMNHDEIMDVVYQSTSDQGFVGIGWYDSGQRNFYTKEQPIVSPSDLAGKRIRVMQSQTSIDTMQLLGASPVVMSQEEVYTSLQQGILDGAENNEFALTAARHGEVVSYYSLDGHARIPDIVLINNNTFNSLSDSQRSALMSAMEESIALQNNLWAEAVDEARRQIQEDFDVTINEVDIAPFREAVMPMYEELEQYPEQYIIYEKIDALRD
ncbi:tripartite ATP-independent transporter solute receptor, DctP family [Franzmannia pantelleriensis]|uniref:Tripartite ATP-independent transporter solute receptor, DctP family n=1 Tax=Franzmannia pantelleriensis TaxID=48727 RepID=A0A1G9R1T6_9GAMM|nr:TRAP transporter substrate-binding protein [Halomonas pantelleriensis]SDM16807.1 tripartite ATP-independent transporter solute receptor, DctP family [Halomonas pantelleriensis]